MSISPPSPPSPPSRLLSSFPPTNAPLSLAIRVVIPAIISLSFPFAQQSCAGSPPPPPEEPIVVVAPAEALPEVVDAVVNAVSEPDPEDGSIKESVKQAIAEGRNNKNHNRRFLAS